MPVRTSSVALVLAVTLCSVLASGAPETSASRSASTSASDGNEANPEAGVLAARHAKMAPYRAAIKAAVAADPRSAPLFKDLRAAFAIRDRAKRQLLLRSLDQRVFALRSDILRKVNLSGKSLLDLKLIDPAAVAKAPALGPELGSVTVTSFPDQYKAKTECPDSSDTWDFDSGKKVIVKAVSTPVDDDCGGVRAGLKSAPIPIPPGAKKMKITMVGHVDLYLAAASVGVYAAAYSEFGVRVTLPSGDYGMGVNSAGVIEPIRSQRHRFHSIKAKHEGPEGLLFPVDISDFEEDLQPGDDKATSTIAFPANVGTTVALAPYVSGAVDADLSGIAELDSDIAIQSLKVTFLK